MTDNVARGISAQTSAVAAAAALSTPPASPVAVSGRHGRGLSIDIKAAFESGRSPRSAVNGSARDWESHRRLLSATSDTSVASDTPLLSRSGPSLDLDDIAESRDEAGILESTADEPLLRKRGPRGLSLSGGRRASAIAIKATRQAINENKGLFMIAASQLLFALMNALVKLMTHDPRAKVPTWELILSRQSITWFGCYITLRLQRVPDPCWGPKEVRGLLFLRGCAGCIGLFCAYTSIQYLSLSDAVVLQFLSPGTTSIAAYFFLNEPYVPREAICCLTSLVGTLFVAQPRFLFGSAVSDGDGVTEEERVMAVGIALFGVVGSTTAYTTLRKIGKRANALQGVEYFAIGCTLMSILMPLVLPNQPYVLPAKPIFWAYLAGIGIVGFIGQMIVGRALQVGSAGRSLLGSFSGLPFALVIQYIMFGETVNLLSGIGSAIIICSTVWVVLTKQSAKHELPAETDSSTDPLLSHTDVEAGKDPRLAAGQTTSNV